MTLLPWPFLKFREIDSHNRSISCDRIRKNIMNNNNMFSYNRYLEKDSQGWEPFIDAPLRDRTIEVVQSVAERLSNFGAVDAIVQESLRKQPEYFGWRPSAFYSGYGGMVLPFLYLARIFSTERWMSTAEHYMRIVAEATHKYPLAAPSNANGSGGMAFVLSLLCQDNPRYQKLHATLNAQLAAQVLHTQWYREGSTGVAAADYDVIYGAAGILAYLVTVNSPDEPVRTAIHILLTYLIWLAGSDGKDKRERWYIPAGLLPLEETRKQYPDGCFDYGLAHGIAGPLAALALAWHAGYRIDGQGEAMRSLSRWLKERCVYDEWGIDWPGRVAFHPSSIAIEQETPAHSSRPSWCYGSPGIARSLWLAGTALDDPTLREIAVEAVESAVRRPFAMRHMDSPIVCHGVAGLLAICLRFAHETESPQIREHIPSLVEQILDMFQPDTPLGFCNKLPVHGEKIEIQHPGFLSGASGVILTLLAASTTTVPDWDRILLIA
jgi:lantibiotic biosynthesis protein